VEKRRVGKKKKEKDVPMLSVGLMRATEDVGAHNTGTQRGRAGPVISRLILQRQQRVLHAQSDCLIQL